MEVEIQTANAGEVDPAEVALDLEKAGWYVRRVSVDDQTRLWDETIDPAPWRDDPNS